MQNIFNKNQITISARRLAEIIHRSGGLAVPIYGGIDSFDGIKIHQKFSAYLSDSFVPNDESEKKHISAETHGEEFIASSDEKSDEVSVEGYDFVCSELSLSGDYSTSEFILKINGRLDNLTIKNQQITLYEIKVFAVTVFLPEHGDPVHWAQLKIYANLLKNIKMKIIQKH